MAELPDDWVLLPVTSGLRGDQAFVPSFMFDGEVGRYAVRKDSLDDVQRNKMTVSHRDESNNISKS